MNQVHPNNGMFISNCPHHVSHNNPAVWGNLQAIPTQRFYTVYSSRAEAMIILKYFGNNSVREGGRGCHRCLFWMGLSNLLGLVGLGGRARPKQSPISKHLPTGFKMRVHSKPEMVHSQDCVRKYKRIKANLAPV